MNYLTHYYKNRCQDLQEQVNLLETLISEAQIRSAQETERVRGSAAGAKREALLKGLLDILNPTLDPLRADKVGKEERDAILRVLGDTARSRAPKPGDERRARNTAAERGLMRMRDESGVMGSHSPTEGLADITDMRAALEALKRHGRIGTELEGKTGERVMKRKAAQKLGPVWERGKMGTDWAEDR